MIFVLPTLKDTLSFSSFPARLKRVTGKAGDRTFFYEITMEVDIEKSLYNDGMTIAVDILPKKPQKSLERKPSKVGSGRSFTRSTKTLEKTLRKKKKQKQEKIISKKNVDLTKYISNSLTKLIKSRKRQADTRQSAGRKTSPSYGSSGVSSGKGSSVSQNPLSSITKLSGGSPIDSTLSSQPVSTTISSRTTIPLKSIASSFITAKKDPAQINKIPVTRLPAAVGEKVQSLLFTPTLQTKQIPQYKIITKKKEIKFRIRIREKLLKSLSSYYIRATIKNDKKVKLEEVGATVQHSKLLNDYLTPIKEPLLETSVIRAGEISVGVKQVDKKAKHIRVFRRRAPAESGGSDAGSGWGEIIDIPLLSSDEEVRFKDKVATDRAIIYRAMSYGTNMRSAEDFASSIVPPLKELKLDQTSALSAVATIKNNGALIVITVSDFPADAVGIMLKRYDLTMSSISKKRSGQGSGFIFVGATPEDQIQFVVGDEDASVNFSDKSQIVGRTYRYVPVAIMKRGKEIHGTDALIEIPLSAGDDEKVQLTTPSPVVIVKNQIPAVSFTLAAKFTDFGFDEVKAALSSGNQETLFDSDLLSERSNFAELINFLVERENFVTGDVESCGVHEAGSFEDNVDTQIEKNITPLEIGVRYGYRITVLIRSPESLFPKLVSESQNISTLLSFQRQVGKFRNPLSLRQGTLQSTARQAEPSTPSRIEPVDPFLAGRTNVQKRIEVTIPIPKRKGYQVSSENRGDNRLLQWSYFGHLSKIDHFQVFACYDGGRQMLGTVHPDAASTKFSFRHFTEGYSVTYFYEVHAMKLDYKISTKLRSQNIVPKEFNKKIKRGSKSSKKIVKF